ncbi:hypothetical protein IE4872_PD00594 (plasmid) [Rhizobium gallicum]|uniref:Uncharacterized protein n=1 Tax=Rhizobium gallicum TaxID=56730 RepID=A0A1L5NT97_9HYPH|nr:hypothetical protein IE4872_PD00594 [Rhizobium gallicum]
MRPFAFFMPQIRNGFDSINPGQLAKIARLGEIPPWTRTAVMAVKKAVCTTEVRAPSRKQVPYDYSSQSEKDHPDQGSARDFTQIILQHDGHLLP